MPYYWLAAGITCLTLEYTVYQQVDEHGYLQESLLLPVGYLCCVLGGVGMLIRLSKRLWAALKAK